MYNHAATNYVCPICLAVRGVENDQTLIKQRDIVYKDETLMVFVSSFFIGNNPGHVIIVPSIHFENLYDLPEEIGSAVFAMSKKVAIALKEVYCCEGITVAQNNEPAGDQHAFHYHFHVFPRYTGDELYKHMLDKKLPKPEERFVYAEKLKEYFSKGGHGFTLRVLRLPTQE